MSNYIGLNIKTIREKWKLTQDEFAWWIDASRGMIMQYEKRGSMPKNETIETIVEKFGISKDMLINTKLARKDVPDMPLEVSIEFSNYRSDPDDYKQPLSYKSEELKNTGTIGTENDDEYRTKKVMTALSKNPKLIPFYDVDIIAGTAEMFDDAINSQPAYYMDVPQFTGCKAFRVYSDSMEPLIESGSIMFCKQIENWHEVLEYGQIYAIQLTDKRRFIKYIRKSKTEGNYLFRSHNSESYDDFEVSKSLISHVWLIEGWMRKKTQ